MKEKIVFLLLAASAFVHVFSAPLEGLVESQYAAQLRLNADSITETQLKEPKLKLLPQHSDLRKFVNEVMSALGPNVAVETLYLYKKPIPSNGWDEAQRMALFNRILTLSTLTGIEYYSASRGAMRVFYESSSVIDGPNTKKPLPDPQYAQMPGSLTLYARQKDLTFGDNIYRYDFRTTDSAFFFAQENLTALTYGIIPAVGKNKLQSVFAVIDCGDSLLIYAVSMAKTASVLGMGDRIGNSFGNRAEAILEWFTGKSDDVFQAK